MDNDFGNDLITISDEEGNDYTLELIDSIEVDGTVYLASLPADMNEDDEDFGILILEVVGDDELAAIEDEDLLEELYDMFMERLFEDDEDFDDDEEDGEDDGEDLDGEDSSENGLSDEDSDESNG